jgi:acetyl-CoA acetyltransferase
MMRKPLDMETYLAARVIGYPLHLYDCCLESDGALAIVLTSASRARDLRQPPVLISGATFGGGHNLYSSLQEDLTVTAAAAMSPRLYAMAGVGPDDIDVAEIYDAFTFLVPLQLEDYGFCGKGEGPAFMADGRTALGGSLPVNTHGGHLSEGYVRSMNLVNEAVRQLRHEYEGTPRQVADAELGVVTSAPNPGSAIVLGRN